MENKKYLDNEGLLYLKGKLDSRFVRQENGKGLSTNDYSNEEKSKLANLDSNVPGYQTASDVANAINNSISGITSIDYRIVEELPATGSKGVIYLISNSGTNPNIYDEYIYVDNKFEKIGTTDVDLSDYVKEEDLVAITNAEINTIFAS